MWTRRRHLGGSGRQAQARRLCEAHPAEGRANLDQLFDREASVRDLVSRTDAHDVICDDVYAHDARPRHDEEGHRGGAGGSGSLPPRDEGARDAAIAGALTARPGPRTEALRRPNVPITCRR